MVMLLCLLQSSLSMALTAQRLPSEDFVLAEQRNRMIARFATIDERDTVIREALPVEELKVENAPEWTRSWRELKRQFEEVRDDRWLEDPEVANFSRRISWLYPDDGCFARASLFITRTRDYLRTMLAKVYVFGSLKAQTANHPDGFVRWWFHVAPVTRFQGEVFVIDPSLNPTGPVTIAEWGELVNQEGDSLRFAICSAKTYTPYDQCASENETDGSAISDQQTYLTYERNRLQRLGRSTETELGDQPPWSLRNRN